MNLIRDVFSHATRLIVKFYRGIESQLITHGYKIVTEELIKTRSLFIIGTEHG